ncbi:MAG: HAD family phosphatase [Verrucomicrobia bacterium]|nr:HAD family phosphatase [Verrucomicrobiota bacterium]
MTEIVKGSEKIVVFDLGKVLLDFDYMKAAGKLVPLCGVFPLKLMGILAGEGMELLQQLELGQIKDDEFYRQLSGLVKFKGTREDFMEIFGDIFTPIDEMIQFHSELKKKGIRTYLFSNTNDTAVKWISDHYPFYNDFDGYFLSYKMKVAKPDDAFYIKLEEDTGKKKDEIIYLDDKQENIDTAVSRGWSAILYTSPEKVIPQVWSLLGIE